MSFGPYSYVVCFEGQIYAEAESNANAKASDMSKPQRQEAAGLMEAAAWTCLKGRQAGIAEA